MKKAFIILLAPALLLLYSCNSNDKTGKENAKVEVTDTVYEAIADDSILYVKNRSMLWHANDSNGLKIHKPVVPGIDTMSAKNVIELINSNYDSIHLDYIKTSHDTIYVHIPHSEMLTERIGSTGAELFMASTTFSLTELKGIHYVNYDFIEGEHAWPGVYDRNDFKNLQ